jgi:hypothetical protein
MLRSYNTVSPITPFWGDVSNVETNYLVALFGKKTYTEPVTSAAADLRAC